MKTRLLVSVRSRDEAVEALRGGATILDVKEPHRGTLGRATVAVQRDVVCAARGVDPSVVVSAALGELAPSEEPPDLELPEGIALFKLGLSGWAHGRGWEDALCMWASHLEARSAALVAVAYADHELAQSPEPLAVLRFAARRRCPFLLVDTFSKGVGSLRTYLADGEIGALVDAAHDRSVRIALAGSLRAEDIEPIAALRPDVIAVRGAACKEGKRELDVDRERVAVLVRSLNSRTRRPASRASAVRGPRALRRE